MDPSIQKRLEEEGCSSVEDLSEEINTIRAKLKKIESTGIGKNKVPNLSADLSRLLDLLNDIESANGSTESNASTSSETTSAQQVKFEDEKREKEREFFINTINNMKTMKPSCAETSLDILRYVFHAEKSRLPTNEPVMALEGDDSVISFLELLKRQIINEQLNSIMKLSNEIANLVHENIDYLRKGWNSVEYFEEALDSFRQIFQLLESNLLKCLKMIRPLDVELFTSCLKESRNSQSKIENQDIILLIGGTGAGKSTLIHFMAGSVMKKISKDHFVPDDFPEELGTVTTSASMKSETKGINCVTIPFASKILHVCDTAGLNDTEGVERDLANGIAMTGAVRTSRSAKVVLVMTDSVIGDRFIHLRDFIHSIKRFIIGLEGHVRSFYYVFNKYIEDEDIFSLSKKAKSLLDNLNPAEQSDADFVAMLNDIHVKTASTNEGKLKENACFRVDLEKSDRFRLCEALTKIIPIENPMIVFKEFSTQASMDKLGEMNRLLKESSMLAIRNCDIELANYRLHQLSELAKLSGLDKCQQAYKECIIELFRFLNDIHEGVYKIIEGYFNDLSNYNPRDLDDMLNKASNSFKLDEMRLKFKDDYNAATYDQPDAVNVLISLEVIENLLYRNINEICNKIKDFSNKINNGEDMNDTGEFQVFQRVNDLIIQLTNRSLFKVDALNELSGLFTGTVLFLENLWLELEKAIYESLASKNYNQIFSFLQTIRSLVMYVIFFNKSVITGYDSIEERIINEVVSDGVHVVGLLDTVTDSTLDEIVSLYSSTLDRIFEFSTLMVKHSNLFKIENNGRISDVYSQLQNRVAVKCQIIEDKFIGANESMDVNQFGLIVFDLTLIDRLRNPKNEIAVGVYFVALVDTLKKAISDNKHNAIVGVQDIILQHSGFSSSASKATTSLEICLQILDNASMLRNYSTEIYSNEFLTPINEIKEYVVTNFIDMLTNLNSASTSNDVGSTIFENNHRMNIFKSTIPVLMRFKAIVIDLLKVVSELNTVVLTDLMKSIDIAEKDFSDYISSGAVSSVSSIEGWLLKTLQIPDVTQLNIDNVLNAFRYMEKSREFVSFSSSLNDSHNRLLSYIDTHITIISRYVDEYNENVRPLLLNLKIDEDNLIKVKQALLYITTLLSGLRNEKGFYIEMITVESNHVKESFLIAIIESSDFIQNSLSSDLSVDNLKLFHSFCFRMQILDEFIIDSKKKFKGYEEEVKSKIALKSTAVKQLIYKHDYVNLRHALDQMAADDDPVLKEDVNRIISELIEEWKNEINLCQRLLSDFSLSLPKESVDNFFDRSKKLLACSEREYFVNFIREETLKDITCKVLGNVQSMYTKCDVSLREYQDYLQKYKFTEVESMYAGALYVSVVMTKSIPFELNKVGPQLTTLLETVRKTITKFIDDLSVSLFTVPLSIPQVKDVQPIRIFENIDKLLQDLERNIDPFNNLHATDKNKLVQTYENAKSKLWQFFMTEIEKMITSAENVITTERKKQEKETYSQPPVTTHSHTDHEVRRGSGTRGTLQKQPSNTNVIRSQSGQRGTTMQQSLRRSEKKIVVKSDETVLSFSECDEMLSDIESVMKYLPSEMHQQLKLSLEHASRQISELKEDQKRAMDHLMAYETNQSWRIVVEFVKYVQSRKYIEMEKLYPLINHRLESFSSQVNANLKEDLLNTISTMNLSHYHYTEYTEWLESAKQNPIPVRTKFGVKYMFLDPTGPKQILHKVRQEVVNSLDSSIKAIMNFKTDFDYKTLDKRCEEMLKIIYQSHETGEENYLFFHLLNLDKTLVSRAFEALVKIGKEIHGFGKVFSEAIEKITRGLQSVDKLTEDLSYYNHAVKEASSKLMQINNCSKAISQIAAFVLTADNAVIGSQMVQFNRLKTFDMPLHSDLKKIYETKVNEMLEIVKASYVHDPKIKSNNASDRTMYYRRVDYALNMVSFFERQSDESEVRLYSSKSDCVKHILDQIDSIARQANDYIEKKMYAMFANWYDNLRAISEVFGEKIIQDAAKDSMTSIDKEFFSYLDNQMRDAFLSENDWNKVDDKLMESVEDKLIDFRIISNSVALYSRAINERIDKLLNDYKIRHGGTNFISRLAFRLSTVTRFETRAAIAFELINYHQAFKGNALLLKNDKLLRATMEQLLKNCTDLSAESQKSLIENNKVFFDDYWNLVNTGLQHPDTSSQLQSIVSSARDASVNHTLSQPLKIRKLLTYVFAYWTLNQSSYYKDWLTGKRSSDPNEDGRKYLLQPHAGQILGLFRMFGIDDTECELESSLIGNIKSFFKASAAKAQKPIVFTNNVAELMTGEGKSVILAVAAIVIALLGFDVDIACYSAYLSERDRESFQSVFTAFAVQSNVRYGTFIQLCESFLNERGNIRDSVQAIIESNCRKSPFSKVKSKQRVLLIDEVDVFFNEEFYCGSYTPYARITSSEIKAFIRRLWSERNPKKPLRLADVKTWPHYQACTAKYSEWSLFIEESTKMLLEDLATFESHDYRVDKKENRIGYPVRDTVSYNRVYRYKTLFAYFKEKEARNITDSALDSNIYLLVDCGGFSYAKVPQRYVNIMGVTGTLQYLSPTEREILQREYNICKETYIPSVFPKNNLDFAVDSSRAVLIESSITYYRTLVDEIQTKLLGVGGISNRAVLVFFESKKKLMDFLESSEFGSYRNEARVMTEDMQAVEREHAIRQAVTAKTITLLSRDFGRGTDFCTYDEKLDAAGGVHVIQTFVSLELSEEIQIRGRTARQGNKGSFSMVLLDTELELFRIDIDMINNMNRTGNRYNAINERRQKAFTAKYQESISHVSDINDEHQKGEEFLKSLYSNNLASVKQFIQRRNVSNIIETTMISKTMILIDATGSMSDVLTKCKNQLQQMFSRIYEILSSKNVAGAFQLQFVVYRNYSSKVDRILEYSSWESDPANMLSFFNDRVKSSGGQGNEAIEIGFLHANREHDIEPIAQVILIGDMPPNTIENVKEKRDGAGGDIYWKKTPYPDEYYYETELNKLIEKGIPVHTFFVPTGSNRTAESVFADISKKTKGTTGVLPIDSPEAAKILTGIVSSRVLNDVGNKFGGSTGGESLVNAYKDKYGFVP